MDISELLLAMPFHFSFLDVMGKIVIDFSMREIATPVSLWIMK